jgi:outer membrane lipoprotein-sorting protein
MWNRFVLASFTFILCGAAHAVTADEIIDNARKVQRVDNGIQQMQMTLVGRNGSKRERRFEMRIRKDGDLVRSYVRFSHPTDVAGTQLVIIDNPDRADEQLLYLPALKRTNRIAGKAKKGSFMGSDFSFEDLEVSDSSDAKHSLVSEDDTVWVIDTTPGEESSYGRIRAHVSKSDNLPRLVEFFDQNDQPKKRLEVLKTATDNGTVIPTHSVMKNLSKNTSTEMTISEWKLNVSADEIPEETFTVGFLERNG